LRLGTFLFARIRRARFLLTWTLQGLWVFLTVSCALAAITAAVSQPPSVLAVPEGRPEGFRHERRGLVAGLRLVAANPAFRRMIGCVVFFVSGIAIQGTLQRLALADVMEDEARFPLMLLVENLATLAAVPL
jgi:Na+/melibiose symporter-like transporter